MNPNRVESPLVNEIIRLGLIALALAWTFFEVRDALRGEEVGGRLERHSVQLIAPRGD